MAGPARRIVREMTSIDDRGVCKKEQDIVTEYQVDYAPSRWQLRLGRAIPSLSRESMTNSA